MGVSSSHPNYVSRTKIMHEILVADPSYSHV